MPSVHLLIKGKVQGVFYRVSAKGKADSLLLNGWVKNTPEGAVEAIATGTKENIQLFVDWCRKGPLYATVSSVEVSEIEEELFDGFQIVKA
jgi:acylphosphatase